MKEENCRLLGRVLGNRGRGRPRKKWLEQVGEYLRQRGGQSQATSCICSAYRMDVVEAKEICRIRVAVVF